MPTHVFTDTRLKLLLDPPYPGSCGSSEAIEVARRQGAKSWELRAATDLCRLWHSQGSPGKREAARQWLAGIYGWFTEGFDLPDLQEAQALLAEFAFDSLKLP